MSEDYRWIEIQRRMDKVERASEQVPVIAVTVAQIERDVIEVRDEARSLKHALYTAALSIVASSVIFALTANELSRLIALVSCRSTA